MFDNGSFLRRRRRFKKKELTPNSTTKLTDALKTLDKFTLASKQEPEVKCATTGPVVVTTTNTNLASLTNDQAEPQAEQLCDTLSNHYYSFGAHSTAQPQLDQSELVMSCIGKPSQNAFSSYPFEHSNHGQSYSSALSGELELEAASSTLQMFSLGSNQRHIQRPLSEPQVKHLVNGTERTLIEYTSTQQASKSH